MYQAFFGLREAPFSLTPDTRYFYPGQSAREALNVLLVALSSGEGFVKVVGDVGTGKTMLCRRLLSLLEDKFLVAYLPNPLLDPWELYRAMGVELGLPWPDGLGFQDYLLRLTRHLADAAAAGRRAALLVDEAQSLPVETLEALRLMTNLETERHKVLQVALFAQPELERRLLSPQGRALRQRITFSHRLTSLGEENGEVTSYVHHRLAVAGWEGPSPFSRAALAELARAALGTPRLVNILGHKSMMAAYGEGLTRIQCRHVRLAMNDTEAAGRGLPFWRLWRAAMRDWGAPPMVPAILPLETP